MNINNDGEQNSWPLVSIIIVNLNGRMWLEKCFKSILASDYPANKIEILLIDNGSTDGSVERISYLFRNDTRVKIIRNEINSGWSPANNQGLTLSKGEICICLSNDIEVDPQCIKEVVKVLKSNSKIGIVQCISYSIRDKKTLDSAMNYLDKFGFAYGYAPIKKPTEVFFAEGMAFAFKREIIRDIGMLDDYYFMEYDDIDFSWRARLAGFKVLFVPSAKVYHARGATVGATYFQRPTNVMLYVRNHFITLIKNYDLKSLFQALPIVLVMQFIKILYFVKARNLKLIQATLKGILFPLKDIKLIMQKRRQIQQKIRKVSDKEVQKFMHPFRPRILWMFLASQAKGQRFILSEHPPIRVD